MNRSDNNNFTVDVIIPVYNCEKYIEEALESVVNQTHQPSSIIIVNDASTDKSEEIIFDFVKRSKNKIEYFKLDENGGPSGARNLGINKSGSEFIAFLDADDVWEVDKLEKQIKIFKESDDPKLGLVYCKYIFINQRGKRVYSQERGNVFYKRGNVEDMLYRKDGPVYNPSKILVLRSILDESYLFDNSLRFGEDFDFLFRLSKGYHFDYVNEALLKIRDHSGNTTKNNLYVCRNAINLYAKYNKHLHLVKNLKENLVYYSYKEKLRGEITDFIKSLPQKVKTELFPISRGNIRLAIIYYLPKWTIKCAAYHIGKLLKSSQGIFFKVPIDVSY